MLREESSRNKWPMCRVTFTQRDRDGFVQSVNVVAGINASRTFGNGILKEPAKKLVLLFEREEENNIEQ